MEPRLLKKLPVRVSRTNSKFFRQIDFVTWIYGTRGSAKKQPVSGELGKNLRYAMALAWAASPKLLIRYSLLGMFNAIMPPVSSTSATSCQ
jgi:hypothetical protein